MAGSFELLCRSVLVFCSVYGYVYVAVGLKMGREGIRNCKLWIWLLSFVEESSSVCLLKLQKVLKHLFVNRSISDDSVKSKRLQPQQTKKKHTQGKPMKKRLPEFM